MTADNKHTHIAEELAQADEALRAAEALVALELFRDAANRLYYAVFHATLALLLTQELVATIHRITTENIDYPNNTPGVYRSHGVRAGTYVPPAGREQIQDLMREFMEWLHGPGTQDWPPTVKAIAAHFYLISVHPFGDGNGRTARAVESFLLHQARINALGFYSLSNFYYRSWTQYIEALDQVRFKSGHDLTPFILFALEGLVAELESVHQEVLNAVAVIAFRDFASREVLLSPGLGRKAGERMYSLLVGLEAPAAIHDLRSGRHPAASAYRSVSEKTFSRDMQYLRKRKLIVVKDGSAVMNLDLMKDYMA